MGISKIGKLVIEAFGLKDVAPKIGVEFIQTIDGTKISKNENYTSMRIRLINLETKDHVMG